MTVQQIAPSEEFVVITPSDTLLLNYGDPSKPRKTKGIYVGGAGNITVKNSAGSTVLFTAPPVGSILPIVTQQVMATNTTATLLIALY